MDFYVGANGYNFYGGDPSFDLIPDFLLRNAPDFGSAISELALTFHFATSGPPKVTLESLYADFHARRQTLPKVVFRRSRQKVAIDIASDMIDGRHFLESRDLSLPLFTAAVTEVVAALSLLRKRVTAKDAFNLEAFLEHCSQARARLPVTHEEFRTLAEQCQQSRAARLAALSPWERLGIDWRDFHPDAREILDDPFYWDCGNDFSPHGNDTGADLLEEYRCWLRRDSSADPIEFYHRLMRKWGLNSEPSGEVERPTLDAAVVALAFAELKLRAACRPAVAALAKKSIRRQRQQAMGAVGWPHRDDRLKSLDRLECKLAGY